MISKLTHIVAFVACAALAGCAFETNAPDDLTNGQADLKKAESSGVETLRTPCAPGEGVTFQPPPVEIVNVIKTDNLLGNPGTDDGPRPHPWQPNPDDNTSSNTGGTSTSGAEPSSSDKSTK